MEIGKEAVGRLLCERQTSYEHYALNVTSVMTVGQYAQTSVEQYGIKHYLSHKNCTRSSRNSHCWTRAISISLRVLFLYPTRLLVSICNGQLIVALRHLIV